MSDPLPMHVQRLGWEIGDTFHVTTDKNYRLEGREVQLVGPCSFNYEKLGFKDLKSGDSEYIFCSDVVKSVKLTIEQTAEAIDKLTLDLEQAEEEVSKANQKVATIEQELYDLQHSLEKLGFEYTPKSQRS